MNKKMILLFSHKLSEEQILDAKSNYCIENFIYLPENLQKIWSNIPPDIESLENTLNLIKEFVHKNSSKNDLVLIQGDFGASFMMVNYCKSLELVTVYATTKRIVNDYIENGQNIKKTIFKHRRFREYA